MCVCEAVYVSQDTVYYHTLPNKTNNMYAGMRVCVCVCVDVAYNLHSGIIRSNWSDAENISMAPAQG